MEEGHRRSSFSHCPAPQGCQAPRGEGRFARQTGRAFRGNEQTDNDASDRRVWVRRRSAERTGKPRQASKLSESESYFDVKSDVDSGVEDDRRHDVDSVEFVGSDHEDTEQYDKDGEEYFDLRDLALEWRRLYSVKSGEDGHASHFAVEEDSTTSDDEDLSSADSPFLVECQICADITFVQHRDCCGLRICEPCFVTYLETKISEGFVRIQCPECNSDLTEYEIVTRIFSTELKQKFHKFLVNANGDATVKTCPRCSDVSRVEAAELKKRTVVKKGLRVTCQECSLVWCFPCHAPWHEGVTCKAFRREDKTFLEWTRQQDRLEKQINARRCPKCKTYIQRHKGCPHMTCSRCGTEFCYDCGQRHFYIQRGNFVSRILIGDHSSRLSPLGCSKNFLPTHSVSRKLIRWPALGARVVGGVALAGTAVALAAAAAGLLVGVAAVTVPVWGGYVIHRRRVRH